MQKIKPRTKYIKLCQSCGVEFTTTDNTKIHCSWDCINKSRDNKIYCKCEVCNKEYFKYKSVANIDNVKYCSMDCKRKAKQIPLICEHCGKEFYLIKHRVSRGDGRYCSYKCSGKARENKIIKICLYCKKEYETFPSREKAGRQYCSSTCYGKSQRNPLRNIHQAIRRLSEYIDWHKTILQRDNFVCRACGKTKTKFNVHHINTVYNILKNNSVNNVEKAIKCNELWDTNNGVTLCVVCHKKIHKRYRVEGISYDCNQEYI